MTWIAAPLLGLCAAAIAPTRAALAKQPPPEPPVGEGQAPAQPPELDEPRVTTDVLPLPSLRIDLGPAFRPAQTPRPSFSVFVDVGVTLYTEVHNSDVLSDLFCCTLIFRPALGYRHDTIEGRRDLAELGLEVGLLGDPPVGVSYRPAFVLGATPAADGVTRLALGIRHGPALTYMGGALSLTISHEYLGLPAPEHGLRIGLAVDLSPFVLVYWGLRMGS